MPAHNLVCKVGVVEQVVVSHLEVKRCLEERTFSIHREPMCCVECENLIKCDDTHTQTAVQLKALNLDDDDNDDEQEP